MTGKAKSYHVLVAVTIAFVMQHTAYADPVPPFHRVDGTVPAFSLNATFTGSPTSNLSFFPDGFSTKFDGADVTPLGGPFATHFSDLTVSHTGVDRSAVIPIDDGVLFQEWVEFHVDPANMSLPSKLIRDVPGGNGSFTFFNVTANVPNPSVIIPPTLFRNALIIQGEERVTSDSNLDFGFLMFFSIFLSASPDVDFINIIETGTAFHSNLDPEAGGGSFIESQTSEFILFPPVVPEPSSLSLILFGLAGLWFARRIARQTCGAVAPARPELLGDGARD
jgi:hypothetical protein